MARPRKDGTPPRMNPDKPEGRPSYGLKITPEMRMRVEISKMMSLTDEQIAKDMGISVPTLYEYYKDELDAGGANVTRNIADNLARKALDGDTTSMIFWLKTRARWKEGMEHYHSGSQEDGAKPIAHNVKIELVEAPFSDDDA